MPPMHNAPRGMKASVTNPGRVFGRIMGFVLKRHPVGCIVIVVCTVLSVIASIQGTAFMKTLIDDFITPLLKQSNPDYSGLLRAMIRVGIFYAVGVIAAFVSAKVKAYVTQKTMRNIRDDMFEHMEKLPIKYFDTHAHGDIMSMYTNDVDTLRQMISQSVPQLINSIIMIVGIVYSMVRISVVLTLVSMIMVVVMLFVTKKVSRLSGKNFVAQQKDIGAVNGYIEEMMEGQKVVKVFCHEDKSVKQFDELNDKLFVSANNANKYSNIIGPINAQLGNLSYVVVAVVGSIFAINSYVGVTLGGLVSFLTFTKNLNMPINQISMQINSIIMALAGGDRIFALLDEKPETDEGYVTLVNVREENGALIETDDRTGMWAWKHFHKESGTTDYVRLQGDVIFDDVDFGYSEDKIVLHNVDLYATPGQKIAFVGSTGAGKTTITNLINRFYDIQDGKIRYDGINVNKIKKADLRRSLGIVLQDTHLFTGTVMENIRYGRLEATDE